MVSLGKVFGSKAKKAKAASSVDDDTLFQPSVTTEASVITPLRQLLDAVNMSILPHDLRLSSIIQAAGFFDHRDRLTHDNELREGAANILYQKLAFALSLSSSAYDDKEDAFQRLRRGGNSTDHEIALICSCLEMVHRASPDAIAATWYDIGEDILPILVRVMEKPFIQHLVSGKANRDLQLAVQKVTKLLAMYSLVPEAKYPIVVCPGLLTVLVKVIDTNNLNRVRLYGLATGSNGVIGASAGSGLMMTEAARFNTIATLTNLAAAEENRIILLTTQDLVDNIARIVQNERADVARQCAALALMNLSNGDKDYVPEMASELLLGALVSLLSDDLPETRRNAAVTLFNVASADENILRVARYKDGVVLGALLEILANDNAEDSRAEVAETLFNMSCSESEETTDRVGNHPGLLEKLAEILLSPRASIDVKLYCAATLRRMAEIIRVPMTAHVALLNALVKAASWMRSSDIAEAFDALANHDENRLAMAQHPGVLNALSGLAQLTLDGNEAEQIRDAAVRTIEKLSRDDLATQFLSSHEDIVLAMTQASFNYNEDSQGANYQAAMKNLVDAL